MMMMLSLLMVMTMKVKIATGKSLLKLSKQDLPYLLSRHCTIPEIKAKSKNKSCLTLLLKGMQQAS